MNEYINNVIFQFKYFENYINQEIKNFSREAVFNVCDENDNYKNIRLNKEKIFFLKNNLKIENKSMLNNNYHFTLDKNNSLSKLVFIDKNKNNIFNRLEMPFADNSNNVQITSLSSTLKLNEELNLGYDFDLYKGISVVLISLKNNNFLTLNFEKCMINEMDYKCSDKMLSKYINRFRTLIELSHEKETLVLDYLFSNKEMSKEEKEILKLTKDIDIDLFEDFRLDLKLNENEKVMKLKI